MGRSVAVALVCLLVLAVWPAWAAEKPKMQNPGVYAITYEIDDAGKMTVKSIQFNDATEVIPSLPGVAFGVCYPEPSQGTPFQAGFRHPDEAKKARFWGVETGFKTASGQAHFYGFIFAQDSAPPPGTYGVNLYRVEDGSLEAKQTFKVVVGTAPAAPAKEQQPSSGGQK